MTELEHVTDSETEQLDATEALDSPGALLSQARDAAGIGREQVAAQLGLSQLAIRDLETNNFAKFPPGIYCRGYLKNYCRFLGVEEAPILDAFDHYCKNNDGLASIQEANVSLKISAKPKKNRTGIWFVLGILLIVLCTSVWLVWR